MSGDRAEERAARFVLDEDAPSNTGVRHYGVWDNEEDDYVGYGMYYEEAARLLQEASDGR